MANRFIQQTFPNYVPPSNLELLMKEGAYKEQQAEDKIQKFQQTIGSLKDLHGVIKGSDDYIKAKRDELFDNIKKISHKNFFDPQVQGELHSLIHEFTRDPYVLNVLTQNESAPEWQKELYGKDFKDPSKRGVSWIMNNDLLQDVWNDPDAYKRTELNSLPNVTQRYDYDKLFDDAFKNLKSTELSRLFKVKDQAGNLQWNTGVEAQTIRNSIIEKLNNTPAAHAELSGEYDLLPEEDRKGKTKKQFIDDKIMDYAKTHNYVNPHYKSDPQWQMAAKAALKKKDNEHIPYGSTKWWTVPDDEDDPDQMRYGRQSISGYSLSNKGIRTYQINHPLAQKFLMDAVTSIYPSKAARITIGNTTYNKWKDASQALHDAFDIKDGDNVQWGLKDILKDNRLTSSNLDYYNPTGPKIIYTFEGKNGKPIDLSIDAPPEYTGMFGVQYTIGSQEKNTLPGQTNVSQVNGIDSPYLVVTNRPKIKNLFDLALPKTYVYRPVTSQEVSSMGITSVKKAGNSVNDDVGTFVPYDKFVKTFGEQEGVTKGSDGNAVFSDPSTGSSKHMSLVQNTDNQGRTVYYFNNTPINMDYYNDKSEHFFNQSLGDQITNHLTDY